MPKIRLLFISAMLVVLGTLLGCEHDDPMIKSEEKPFTFIFLEKPSIILSLYEDPEEVYKELAVYGENISKFKKSKSRDIYIHGTGKISLLSHTIFIEPDEIIIDDQKIVPDSPNQHVLLAPDGSVHVGVSVKWEGLSPQN